MTTVDYNKKKNKILKRHLGIDFDLIPEELNVETILTQEQVDTMDANCSSRSCVYCLTYNKIDKGGTSCEGCPLVKDGKDCESYDSNWMRYKEGGEYEQHTVTYSPAHTPMRRLIRKFKKEFKVTK